MVWFTIAFQKRWLLETQVLVYILTVTRGGERFPKLTFRIGGAKQDQDFREGSTMCLMGCKAMLILLQQYFPSIDPEFV